MTFTPTAEPLTADDARQVAVAFKQRRHRHSHLDWFSLYDWLTSPQFYGRATHAGSRVDAVLGASLLGGEQTAWLRLMLPVNGPGFPGRTDHALDVLWRALQKDLAAAGAHNVVALGIEDWASRLMRRWGFERINSVITLRRAGRGHLPVPELGDVWLRQAQPEDIPAVAALDAAAFDEVWRCDVEALAAAFSQAEVFSVVQTEHDLIGYQVSTLHDDAGHLARLAVLPAYQGRGLGRTLLADAVNRLLDTGVKTVTVNTQADNHRSQQLYQASGFSRSGQIVPLWAFPLR